MYLVLHTKLQSAGRLYGSLGCKPMCPATHVNPLVSKVAFAVVLMCTGSHGFCLLNNLAIGASYAMNVHR